MTFLRKHGLTILLAVSIVALGVVTTMSTLPTLSAVIRAKVGSEMVQREIVETFRRTNDLVAVDEFCAVPHERKGFHYVCYRVSETHRTNSTTWLIHDVYVFVFGDKDDAEIQNSGRDVLDRTSDAFAFRLTGSAYRRP